MSGKVRTTAKWLRCFRDDLISEDFDPELVHELVLLAAEAELRNEGLVVADG